MQESALSISPVNETRTVAMVSSSSVTVVTKLEDYERPHYATTPGDHCGFSRNPSFASPAPSASGTSRERRGLPVLCGARLHHNPETGWQCASVWEIMIDMRTGDVWGFPTLVQSPYPVSAKAGDTKAPKSEPIYLGQFVLEAAKR